jgi:RNA polymerase sigma factor (TIGR02999 family)
MPDSTSVPITQLLLEARKGDKASVDILVSAVYQELHRIASRMMRAESSGNTLQPTAVVHEAFLRIFRGAKTDWKDRSHFFAVAARQIRYVLVDHARAKLAAKRGSRTPMMELDAASQIADTPPSVDILALDELLDRLAKADPRSEQVVELKYFAGMTDSEVSEHLGIAQASVRRDWEFARAWLARHWDKPRSKQNTEK